MSYEILLFHATMAKWERILHHWFAIFVSLLPVGSGSLRSEIHPVRSDVLLVHNFTEAEVRDLDLPTDRPTPQENVPCKI